MFNQLDDFEIMTSERYEAIHFNLERKETKDGVDWLVGNSIQDSLDTTKLLTVWKDVKHLVSYEFKIKVIET